MPRKPRREPVAPPVTAPQPASEAQSTAVALVAPYPDDDEPTDEMGPYERVAIQAKFRRGEAAGDIDADVEQAGIEDVSDPISELFPPVEPEALEPE